MSTRADHSWYGGRTILVTGGLGFLGSNLVHALVRWGARVRVLDALLEPYGGNMHNLDGVADRVSVTVADIRDTAAVAHVTRDVDVVFHIAAQTSHVDSMTDPFLDLDMNGRGNLMLLQALQGASCRLVYAGTRAQYGRVTRIPVDEEHRLDPIDIYGVHKAAAEQQCFIMGRLHGFPVVSLRINNTYGPRHQMKHARYGILNWFVRVAMDGGVIPVYAPGDQLRDYNHVDDVTEAFLLAGHRPEAEGRVFNLGSGGGVRFVDMVDAVVSAAGAGAREMVPWPEERRRIEVGDYLADIGLARRLLGWEPRIPLDEGLRRTVDYYRDRREHYW